ncbi:MAG TPA: tRNA (adenosine(37)-N6)-dimethylallyltransferase MiaA [Candidatus Hydrogenedentes bacterium]|jgi:tRNA dimethylallyltransferase|nr:tRNA (adenosine(37)-N6)-dimethylallyltransferase MiaA [Candidatus Hydrogenedentota bacterium]
MHTEGVNMLVVLGPTASGKTALGVYLADILGGEIISADSRQVYRGLDIGSGKDLGEYVVNGRTIPYHLIDIVDLSHEFSVFEYQQRCFAAFEAISGRGALPVMVGGTGLYIEAVLRGYRMVEAPEDARLREELSCLSDEALAARLVALKPGLHNTTDLTDRNRLVRAIEIAEYTKCHPPAPAPSIRPFILGTRWDRKILRHRIGKRLQQRFDAGMIEEVEGLRAQGVPWEKLHFLGLEYRYIADYLQGRIATRDELYEGLWTAICQFAKRQETWFRRMERNGAVIHWIDNAAPETALELLRTRDAAIRPL